MSSSLSKLLLSFPPKETGATAVYPFSTALQRRFTVTSRFGEQYPLYRVDGKWIHLPRAVCPIGPCDMRDAGTPVTFHSTIQPRNEDQARVFAEVAGFLKEGLSGQVQAQTAFGKTPLALHAIAEIGRKTLVVVTKEDLLRYWVEEAKKFLQLTDAEVGVIQQDKCQVVGKKLVVALIHSLSIEDRYPKEIVDGFGLVVFDECIAGDAAITLADGSTLPMQELVARLQEGETFEVLSYNIDSGAWENRTVSFGMSKGQRQVLEVELDNGRKLVCTEDHLILTRNRGYVAAGRLIPDDDVVAP